MNDLRTPACESQKFEKRKGLDRLFLITGALIAFSALVLSSPGQ